MDHRRHQNVVKKTSVTHSTVPHVWLFCSYYILLSSVTYHWVYAGQHEIQIFNWYLQQITFGNKNLNKYHSLFLWYDVKCRWESSHKLLLKSWRKLQKNFKQNSVIFVCIIFACYCTKYDPTYCNLLYSLIPYSGVMYKSELHSADPVGIEYPNFDNISRQKMGNAVCGCYVRTAWMKLSSN